MCMTSIAQARFLTSRNFSPFSGSLCRFILDLGLHLRSVPHHVLCIRNCLPCLLHLPMPLLDQLQSLSLGLFLQPCLLLLKKASVGQVLLVLEDCRVRPRLELLRGLSHDDLCDSPVHRRTEPPQDLLAFVLHQIALDLHDNVISRLRRHDRCENSANTEIIHHGDPEVHVGSVVGIFPAAALRFPEAAAQGPINDLSVREFGEIWIRLQKLVEPVESALIRKTNRHHHLVLAIHQLRRIHPDGVLLCRILNRATLERKRSDWVDTPVHVQRHILEVHVREQSLPVQTLWQRLGLRDALAFPEDADRVRIGAGGIQIKHHANGLVHREPL
mmetsp:Transcript_50741/g.135297  ORF Transcript_50741/g.135297 Transcript_50741/m.135297 type:complete len:330 (+) Transcript_50741:1378-2367(+)